MQTILTQKNRLKVNEQTMDIVRKLSYHSARLYNVGLYLVKQHWFNTTKYLGYVENYHLCKSNKNYKLLLANSGQQILRIVERDMRGFFGLLRAKQKGKYSAKINTPNYKKDYFIIVIQGRDARIRSGYVLVTLSKGFKEKYNIDLKCLKFKLPSNIKVEKLRELRIVPNFNGKIFDIEFVYYKEFTPNILDKDKSLGIDLGVNNFASCFSSEGDSFIIDGRKLKSVNQLFNKILSKTQKESNKRIRNSVKRKNQINSFFNLSVKYITDYCIKNNIGHISLGILTGAKQSTNIGRVNNQNFCSIPYGLFIRKLQSKCLQAGIELHLQDESYTSKCSFLDKEEVRKHQNYMGKRTKRGLFKTKDGILVNADINGAANILVKSKRRLSERAYSGFINNPLVVKF